MGGGYCVILFKFVLVHCGAMLGDERPGLRLHTVIVGLIFIGTGFPSSGLTNTWPVGMLLEL